MSGTSSQGKAVFGPVPSRRLGLSLGVDLLWPKTCSLDCVYCELGPTTELTNRRKVFRNVDQVLGAVAKRLAQLKTPPDFITLAGSGEPTLHLGLGEVLSGLRDMSPARLAILTNATLTPDPAVRQALALADVVVPSLDAVSPHTFARINRPAPGIHPEDMIEGLVALRHEMSGELWLEILLVGGINDHPDEIKALKAAAGRIKPDLVQLNTVIRPPAVRGVSALNAKRLAEIAEFFAMNCEVIAPPNAKAAADPGKLASEVVEMTRRRPCTLQDVANMAGVDQKKAGALIKELMAAGRLKAEVFGETVFYRGV